MIKGALELFECISRVSAVCCCYTFSFALQAKEAKTWFCCDGSAAILVVFHTSDSCGCANKWNTTLSWGYKFFNMLFIKDITLGHLTSLTNYKDLVKLLKMLRFCFSMSHVLVNFSCYCSISMTALVPPKSQGLEVYFLLKGEIFIQLHGSRGWGFKRLLPNIYCKVWWYCVKCMIAWRSLLVLNRGILWSFM